MRRFGDQEYTPQKKFIAAMVEALRADFEYSPVGLRRFRLPGGGVRVVADRKFARQNAGHSHDPLRRRLAQLSRK